MPTNTEPTANQQLKAPIESILKTVRQSIGPGAQYTVFDNDLIIHINAAFSRLCQLGVGPEIPFKITGEDEVWTDFIDDGYLEEVKQYICLKTRMIFDTPASSTVANAIKEQIDTLEWTMRETARFGY